MKVHKHLKVKVTIYPQSITKINEERLSHSRHLLRVKGAGCREARVLMLGGSNKELASKPRLHPVWARLAGSHRLSRAVFGWVREILKPHDTAHPAVQDDRRTG